MVSSLNYDYDDRGASSELRGLVRSTRSPCSPQPFCTEPPCEQPWVVRRTPSDLFRIFGRCSAHLWLARVPDGWKVAPPSGRAEGFRKQANHEAPAKQITTKRMPGRPPQHLPKRWSQLSPQPRRAWNVRQLSDSTRRRRWRSQNKGPRKKKVSRQSRTVAGSTEGRKRSRSSSSRREESREESTETTTATAAGIGICSSSVRRSAPRRQQLGQRGGTATSTPSLWHGML